MKKHGLRNTKIYAVWTMMKQRCFNQLNQDYYNYGDREITVCDEWLSIVEFYNWSINNGYKEGLTLDRINPNGNYEPGNCRWITNAEQQRNKRNSIRIIYNDTFMSLTELSEVTGIRRETLEMRYIRGDRGERLVRAVRHRSA